MFGCAGSRLPLDIDWEGQPIYGGSSGEGDEYDDEDIGGISYGGNIGGDPGDVYNESDEDEYDDYGDDNEPDPDFF